MRWSVDALMRRLYVDALTCGRVDVLLCYCEQRACKEEEEEEIK
jgi:hypothetical protein